jgi:hypothetical protein
MALPHNADAVSCYGLRTGVPPFYTQRHIPGNATADVEMRMERHNSLPGKRVLTEPFGVLLRAIEARAGFVELILAFQGGGPRALQKVCDLGLRERLEGADGFEGLVEDQDGQFCISPRKGIFHRFRRDMPSYNIR